MLNLKVEGIHCGGCASSIKKALAVAAPGSEVEVDIDSGKVKVGGSPDRAKVVSAIEDAGYDVTGDAA
ncbi:heavy-metal-associated domain-containing protein [Dongia rigui]|uniref:Heavy-metal-associated domain-containing protein n=1 Tax=Dongia rigui TaxID=940149 RepID=A0ABU5DTL8_9PROT|nr:heavy-metal-associated domain-containing protein [Dongia rigui]MDY0870666.1 heavy-metal-associated domain-containing protein [Dongia rigui]